MGVVIAWLSTITTLPVDDLAALRVTRWLLRIRSTTEASAVSGVSIAVSNDCADRSLAKLVSFNVANSALLFTTSWRITVPGDKSSVGRASRSNCARTSD